MFATLVFYLCKREQYKEYMVTNLLIMLRTLLNGNSFTYHSNFWKREGAWSDDTSAVRRLVGMQRGVNFTIVSTMLTKTWQSIMYVAAPLVIQPTSL